MSFGMIKIVTAILFAIVFGFMFVYYGARRIAGMAREPKPAEAAFWGGFGVLVGLVVIVTAGWVVFHPDPDEPDSANAPGKPIPRAVPTTQPGVDLRP